MKEGPSIAIIGSLVGDPARANILTALMGGQALTATELAGECGITPQTVSSHLGKLEAGGLILRRKQGRHHYFSLSGNDVGELLERIMDVAANRGHQRVRTGPRDPALRQARVCYDHLAGDRGVIMLDAMQSKQLLHAKDLDITVTEPGRQFFQDLGIDVAELEGQRRPVCKACLDWSARRSHLAGSLGAAMLDRIFALGWARRVENSRVVRFSARGEQEFDKLFAG